MTLEEFRKMPLTYTYGINGDAGASRLYRNEDLGIQMEVHTKRKRKGDIYSGWEEGAVSYFLDGDDREFKSVDDLYGAWSERSKT
jgi:hypothetical protein